MWLAIISFIITLIQKFCTKTASVVGSVWSGVSEVASSVGTSVVDWFKDDEVSTTKKVAAIVGAGYVLAPDATSSVVSKIGEGVADVANTAVDTTESVLDGLFSSKYGWLLVLGGGLLLYKMLED